MDAIAAISPALNTAGTQGITQAVAPADGMGDSLKIQPPDASEIQSFMGAAAQPDTVVQSGITPEFQAAMPIRERSMSADLMRKLDIQVANFDKAIREVNTTTVTNQNGGAHHDHSSGHDGDEATSEPDASGFNGLVSLLQDIREASLKQSLTSISMDFVNNTTSSLNRTFNDLLKGQ